MLGVVATGGGRGTSVRHVAYFPLGKPRAVHWAIRAMASSRVSNLDSVVSNLDLLGKSDFETFCSFLSTCPSVLVDGDIGAEMGIDEECLWSDLPSPLKDILLWAAASGCSTRLLSLGSKSCVQFSPFLFF
jgi:hypothetical protein